MKLKVFKKIDKDRLTEKEKLNIQIADQYVQNHGMPKTRREFLASGLKASLTYLLVPSITSVLSRSIAAAADCGGNAATKLPAAVVINGNGGFAVGGNFVFTDQGGSLLPSYSRLGMGATGSFGIDQTFGANGGNFVSYSGILAGIQGVATPATLANTVCLGIACQSQDDTSNNALNPTGMLAEVLKGDFLPVLGSNRNQPAVLPNPAPLAVGGHDDIENAVGVNGSIENMSDANKARLFSSINRLTESQSTRLSSLSGGEALGVLSSQATSVNTDLISGVNSNVSINPLDNTEFSALWGVNANNLNNGNGGDASAVYNALVGNATMVGLQIGGCDYHNNGRGNTDGKDVELGTMVGRALESARILNRPTMVMMTTDGSVASQDSITPGAEFTSDSGNRSGIICFFYHPQRRPNQIKRQLGHYTEGQVAARDTAVGGSPDRGVAGAIVNFLSFAGRSDLAAKVTRNTFSALDLGDLMVIS